MDSKIGGRLKNDIDASVLCQQLENKLNIGNVKMTISKDLFELTEDDFNIPTPPDLGNKKYLGNISKKDQWLSEDGFDNIKDNLYSENKTEIFNMDIITDEIIQMFTELRISDPENVLDTKDLKMEIKKQNKSKVKHNKSFKKDKLLKDEIKVQNKELKSDTDLSKMKSSRELNIIKNLPKYEDGKLRKESLSKIENKESIPQNQVLNIESKGVAKEKDVLENKETVFENEKSNIEIEGLVKEKEVLESEETKIKNDMSDIENKELVKEKKVLEIDSKRFSKKSQVKNEELSKIYDIEIKNEKHEDNRKYQQGKKVNEESKAYKNEVESFKKEDLRTENEVTETEVKVENDLPIQEDKEFVTEKDAERQDNEIKNKDELSLKPKLRKRAPEPKRKLNRLHIINQNYTTRNDSDAYAERLRFLSGSNVIQVQEPLQFQLENSLSSVSNVVQETNLELENSLYSLNVSDATVVNHGENYSVSTVNSPESGYETSPSSTPFNNLEINEDDILNSIVDLQFESPSKIINEKVINSINDTEKFRGFFEDCNISQGLNLSENESEDFIHEYNNCEFPVELLSYCNIDNKRGSSSSLVDECLHELAVNHLFEEFPAPSSSKNDDFAPNLPIDFLPHNNSIDKGEESLSSYVTECLKQLAVNHLSEVSEYEPESSLSNSEFSDELPIQSLSNANSEFTHELELSSFFDAGSEFVPQWSKATSSSTNYDNMPDYSNSASSIFSFDNRTDLRVNGNSLPNVRVINLNSDLSESASLPESQGSPKLPIECKPLKNTIKEEFRRSLSYAKFHSAQAKIYKKIDEAALRDEKVKIIYIPDENSKACENQTNLHLAVINKKVEEIYCIVEVQKQWNLPFSEFSLRDKHGKTPLDYAVEQKMDLVVDYLKENHACRSIKI